MRQANNKCLKTTILLTFLGVNLICSSVFGSLYTFHQDQRHVNTKRDIKYGSGDISSQLNNLAGKPGEGYYLQVEIGTPPQKLNVLIDTGSSNLAVACYPNEDITTHFYRNRSSTFKELGKTVNVPYTQGSWNGILGQDYVTISSLPNSTVFATIACIDQANDFFINNSNWQGIMGLAYAGIARPDSSVEPIYDTLTREGMVKDVFSVALCGLGTHSNVSTEPMGGSIIFGGADASLYTGTLYSTPIEKRWYYDVIIVDILVNNQSLGMDCKEYNFGKTIVDTGTTNLRLPTRVFDTLQQEIKHSIMQTSMALPGPGFWSGDEVLCWNVGSVAYQSFPIISLALPTNATSILSLDISPLQYLRPVEEENDIPGQDCFKLGISSIESGTVIGAVIMEGFYVVFDRDNDVVKFGTSACPNSVKSAPKSTVKGNIIYTGNYKDCAYLKPQDVKSNAMTIAGYIVGGIFGLAMVPLVTLIVYYKIKNCQKCKTRSQSGIDYNDLRET